MRVICYTLDVELLREDFDSWLALLPKERKEKCLRYVQMKDRLLSLGGSLLIEKFVGKGEYLYNERGKPRKKNGPRFSLSHSGTYCLLAVAQNDIGADLEIIADKDQKLIAYCFDEEEQTRIKTKEDFYLAWCEKEALGKLIGFGIKDPKKDPVRHIGKGRVEFEGGSYYLTRGRFLDYAYALAAKEQFDAVFEHVKLETLKV